MQLVPLRSGGRHLSFQPDHRLRPLQKSDGVNRRPRLESRAVCDAAGLYKFNAVVTLELESAWFQP
jgi:hypothetical protein